jgi:hypothetical protein
MASLLRDLWGRTRALALGGEARRWARESGGAWGSSDEGNGFSIVWPDDSAACGGPGLQDLRLEWGEPTRHYIGARELRVRAIVNAQPPASRPDLHLLLMERALAERLEREVFAQATGGVQTRLDDHTPEEMRWIVLLYPAAAGPAASARHTWAAWGQEPQALERWLAGGTAAAADAFIATRPPQPLVLALHEGRIALRCALPLPDVTVMQRACELLGSAARAAWAV